MANICTSIRRRLYNFLTALNASQSLGLHSSHIFETVPPAFPIDRGVAFEIEREERDEATDYTDKFHSERRTFKVKLIMFWGNTDPNTRGNNIENIVQGITEAVDQSTYLLDGIDSSSGIDPSDNGEVFDNITIDGWNKIFDGAFSVGAEITMTWHIHQTWLKDTTIEITNSTLQTPQLLDPVNGGQSETDQVIFSWDAVDGSTDYQIQVSWDGLFGTNTFYADEVVAGTSQMVRGLDADIPIYWRVRAHNDSGYSRWSDIWTLEVALP